MTLRSELGGQGEDLACDFLKDNGFLILFRNFWQKWGEIDIIARDKDKTLVFVEVKTIRQYGNAAMIAELTPEDQMTSAKIRKFKRMAELFANDNPELINEKAGWRLDLIGITFDDSVKPIIRHYKNIS